MSPSGGFASLAFDQAVPKNSQRHLADQNAICILHRSDCAWLCCLLSLLHFDSVQFLNQLMIFLNFNRLSYDKTIESSENEPATLVLYLELKNRNRERHQEYLVKIIFKLKYKKIF